MVRPVLKLVGNDLGDPRAAAADELAEASRNAFPIVATRAARKDGLGLVAGAAVALALGGLTFWSMAGHRHPKPTAAPAPAASLAAAPAILPPSIPVLAVPSQVLVPGATMTSPGMAAGMSFAQVAPTTPTMPLPLPSVQAGAEPAPDTSMLKHEAAPALVLDNGSGTAPTVTLGLPADSGLSHSADAAEPATMRDPSRTVAQGTLIPAVMETALDSDLPGFARAVVARDIMSFDGKRLLIPRSSRLIGEYKSGLAEGQTRAYLLWTRLILPDGSSISLSSPATDLDGRTGLQGEVNSHFLKRFGSAILLSIVGSASAVGSGSIILAGSQSAASVALQRDGQVPPTIRVRAGQPLRVFVARDLDFSSVGRAGAP